MAQIRVTVGGCGVNYTTQNGQTQYKLRTAADGVFECPADQAARLVALHVAEYAAPVSMKLEDTVPPAAGTEGTGDEDEETVKGHLDPEQLATMTIEQLKQLAEDMEVDVTACKKKADYVAAISAVEVEAGGIEDGDEPPSLSAADPE